MSKTLYEKLWDSHVVHVEDDGTALLYIDRHLVHEVTSPQAFEGLKLAGRKPWRISSIVATADHNTPTSHWERGILDPVSRQQVETLDANIRETGALAYFPFKDKRQGIVHVVGPENGATLPGMTVVCGDSHTSTHGAFACLAHGIGTSEVEHVLATQCLLQKKSKTMLVRVEGKAGPGVTAKDIVLALIGRIGTAGGTGYAIEFGGSAIACAVDGRSHDGLQHGDRGRRPGRLCRRRRHDHCLPQGSQLSRRRVPIGTRPWPIGAAWCRMPMRTSTPWSRWMPAASCRR
jgi:3-isopropylmalate/(R)-2-methylmalate dehydratase large subunit